MSPSSHAQDTHPSHLLAPRQDARYLSRLLARRTGRTRCHKGNFMYIETPISFLENWSLFKSYLISSLLFPSYFEFNHQFLYTTFGGNYLNALYFSHSGSGFDLVVNFYPRTIVDLIKALWHWRILFSKWDARPDSVMRLALRDVDPGVSETHGKERIRRKVIRQCPMGPSDIARAKGAPAHIKPLDYLRNLMPREPVFGLRGTGSSRREERSGARKPTLFTPPSHFSSCITVFLARFNLQSPLFAFLFKFP